MENNKLLDVTNYFLENANNGILNIVDKSELLQENNFKDILIEENIKKVRYLYKVAVLDMKEYLSSSYNYLVEELENEDFIEFISDEYKHNNDYYTGCDITLRQHGPGNKSDITFKFYIAFYYTNESIKRENDVKKPVISFELYLYNEKYNLDLLRQKNHSEEYTEMPKWFDDGIYAYELIDYNQNITSKQVAVKAAEFLKKYLKDKLEDIKNAQYKNNK